MNRYRYAIATALLCMTFSASLPAAEIVKEFTGTRTGHTGVFEVKAPWLLDWRVVSDFPEALALDVSLVDAETGAYEGAVLKTRYVNNGVRLFRKSGRFQFKVDALMARWTLRVEELTEEEAAQYTPVR